MTRPARVLQLITELRPGGAERIVYEIARGLHGEDFEMEVCSLRPADGAVAGWLREAGLTVHSLDMTYKFDPGGMRRLQTLLKEREVRLLHSHLVHANVLGRMAAHGVGLARSIGTAHIVEKRFRPWHFWCERLTLHAGDVEVCVSNAVRDFLVARRLPEKQLRVIPNGIDLDKYKPLDDGAAAVAKAALFKALNLPAEASFAVAVGRLEPQKNYPLLLDAWEQALGHDESADAHLLIAGEGTQRARLQKRIDGSAKLKGRAHLLGHRENVALLFSVAEVAVQASAYEGFGLAVAEAMACRVPVVATAVDSVPEVVGVSGEGGAGVLVPPGDAGALAAALVQVLSMDGAARTIMGEVSRRRVEEHYSLTKMLAGYRALYEDVLNADA